MVVKFVGKKDIPPRKKSGDRKYQALYSALKKKPGEWAEVDKKTKTTLDGRNDGVRTYPDVATMKREDRYFVAYIPKPKKARKAKRAKK